MFSFFQREKEIPTLSVVTPDTAATRATSFALNDMVSFWEYGISGSNDELILWSDSESRWHGPHGHP